MDRTISVARGTSLLVAVRAAGLPMGSSCGGKAVCAWCRVRVLEGRDRLSPPSAEEQRLLARVEAQPEERLACLAVPLGPVVITTTYW